MKLPFSGTGPFEVKVKKDGKEVLEDSRVKISPFDDFVTFVIKGEFGIYVECSHYLYMYINTNIYMYIFLS